MDMEGKEDIIDAQLPCDDEEVVLSSSNNIAGEDERS